MSFDVSAIWRWLVSALCAVLCAGAAQSREVILTPDVLSMSGEPPLEAERGLLFVPENRADPASRIIAVHFLRFRALTSASDARESKRPPVFLQVTVGAEDLRGLVRSPNAFSRGTRLESLSNSPRFVVELAAGDYRYLAAKAAEFRMRERPYPLIGLLINGDLDWSTPIENARHLRGFLKQGHLVEIGSGTHCTEMSEVMAQQPGRMRQLYSFIDVDFTTVPPTRFLTSLPAHIALAPLRFQVPTGTSLYEQWRLNAQESSGAPRSSSPRPPAAHSAGGLSPDKVVAIADARR